MNFVKYISIGFASVKELEHNKRTARETGNTQRFMLSLYNGEHDTLSTVAKIMGVTMTHVLRMGLHMLGLIFKGDLTILDCKQLKNWHANEICEMSKILTNTQSETIARACKALELPNDITDALKETLIADYSFMQLTKEYAIERCDRMIETDRAVMRASDGEA